MKHILTRLLAFTAERLSTYYPRDHHRRALLRSTARMLRRWLKDDE